MGMAWAAVGYTEWQLNLILPGYEERVLYYPKGSKSYLMCNDNKRAKNSHGSGNYSNTSDGSDRSNQGETPKTNPTMVTMVTMEAVKVSKWEVKTPMRTKTRR